MNFQYIQLRSKGVWHIFNVTRDGLRVALCGRTCKQFNGKFADTPPAVDGKRNICWECSCCQRERERQGNRVSPVAPQNPTEGSER